MGLQNIINRIYRYPKSNWKHMRRFGGYFSYRKMLKANERMKAAAKQLPPVPSYAAGAPVFFLTGQHFFHQTLFCVTSLTRVTGRPFQFVLADDGSLDIRLAREKLPGAIIVTAAEIEENLANQLPAAVYPQLMAKRQAYTHLKKLTDIHSLGIADYKLVLDSDMLFWKEPGALLAWLDAPQANLFMQDSHQSYGYSPELMEALCGAAIPERLNVGVAGLRSGAIDWEAIAGWIRGLEAQQGGSYYLEQALTAMLAAGSPLTILAPEEYIVYPADEQIRSRTGTLHHYVDLSKKGYLMQAWQELL